MDWMSLFQNRMLLSSLYSWAAAQILKTIIYWITNKKLDLHRIVGDGGMPSGHSATVTALATTAAIEYGLDSPVFAIAAILAIVVMHDAMGVRLEAGKHAKIINELNEFMHRMVNDDIKVKTKLKEFVGHTPLQVFFGAILGLVMAIILG